MTADFRILGWESKNLRIPDFEFKIADNPSEVPLVTLVQGPNGTAKTTTLTLMRAALSGEAANWDPERVKSFAKRNSLHRSSENDDGLFRISTSCEGRRWTYEIKFDFKWNKCTYTTVTPTGRVDVINHPPVLRPFLTDDFTRLFIFDGEEANALSAQNKTKARDAIEVAHRIYIVKKLSQIIDQHYQTIIDSIPTRGRKSLEGKKMRVSDLKQYLRKRTNEYADLKRSLSEAEELDRRLGQQTNEKLAKINTGNDELQKSTQLYNNAEADYETNLNTIALLSRNPIAVSSKLGKKLRELYTGLEKAKLPESTAREFFSDLACQVSCVCGRPIGPVEKNNILSSANEHLASDAVHILNQIKSSTRDHIETSTPIYDNFNRLLQLSFEKQNIRNDAFEKLESAKEAASQVSPELKKDIENLKKNRERISELKNIIQDYEERNSNKGDSDTLSISTLEKRLQEADIALSAELKSVELLSKKDILLKIVNRIVEEARVDVTATTISDTNKLLQEVMPLNSINVSNIEDRIQLSSDGSSMGETLVVAYAFLSSLLRASPQISMPFVVDSPAGALGGAVRQKLAKAIPEMTQQSILFVLDKEKDAFLDPLEKKINSMKKTTSLNFDKVKYFTMFKKGHVEMPKGGKLSKCQQGVLVEGRDFFINFK